MGVIGLIGGVFYAELSVSNRLQGYAPNEPEVKKYGFYTAEELELYSRDLIENGELIGRNPIEKV